MTGLDLEDRHKLASSARGFAEEIESVVAAMAPARLSRPYASHEAAFWRRVEAAAGGSETAEAQKADFLFAAQGVLGLVKRLRNRHASILPDLNGLVAVDMIVTAFEKALRDAAADRPAP